MRNVFQRHDDVSRKPSSTAGRIRLLLTLLATLLVATFLYVPASQGVPEAVTDPQLAGVREAYTRILGEDGSEKFDLYFVDPQVVDGYEMYQVSGSEARIAVQASSQVAALRGLNDYLGSVGQSISWNANNLDVAKLVAPSQPITSLANVPNRFYGNDTEDGYTGAFRDWQDWQSQIDMLAVHGFNEVFVPVGAEMVYYLTMQEYGYSAEEMLQWIPAPTHQPWWLLQNMSSFPTQMSLEAIQKRVDLAKKIINRLNELGMKAVIPGYFGTVPNGFAERNPGAKVVPQGDWVGFQRPDWLDPNSELYSEVAASFYKHSAELFGVAPMYKMDLLHEGGLRGDVDVPQATKAVEQALQTAAPGAIWVLLGWQQNPPSDVAANVNPATTLIVDGLSDRYPDGQFDRETQWSNRPYAFGTIWNFGGDTTMGAKISVANQRYFQERTKEGSAMTGLAVLPEGGNNNPAALDFYASLPWMQAPTELDEWFTDWATRRYGSTNESAAQAWEIIGQTAYSLDNTKGFSEAQDSLYAAEPNLGATTSSVWSPTSAMYDLEKYASALEPLIAASDELADNPAYQFDLMDVSRQVLSNTGRVLLPQILDAFNSRDSQSYQKLTKQYLDNLALLDKVAGTSQYALLSTLLNQAQQAGTTASESNAFEMSQRTILTVWGTQSGYLSGLRDYAGREIQGLICGYYAPRWQKYFDAGLKAMEDGQSLAQLNSQFNWFNEAQSWINSTQRGCIADQASGNIVELARQVVEANQASQPPAPQPSAQPSDSQPPTPQPSATSSATLQPSTQPSVAPSASSEASTTPKPSETSVSPKQSASASKPNDKVVDKTDKDKDGRPSKLPNSGSTGTASTIAGLGVVALSVLVLRRKH